MSQEAFFSRHPTPGRQGTTVPEPRRMLVPLTQRQQTFERLNCFPLFAAIATVQHLLAHLFNEDGVFVADALSAITALAMTITTLAMAIPMAMSTVWAIAMGLGATARMNLSVNPLLMAANATGPAEHSNLAMVTGMVTPMVATCRRVARKLHHMRNFKQVVVTTIAVALSGWTGRVLKCGSMPTVTSVAIASS